MPKNTQHFSVQVTSVSFINSEKIHRPSSLLQDLGGLAPRVELGVQPHRVQLLGTALQALLLLQQLLSWLLVRVMRGLGRALHLTKVLDKVLSLILGECKVDPLLLGGRVAQFFFGGFLLQSFLFAFLWGA